MAKKKVDDTALIKGGYKALIVGILAVLICGVVWQFYTSGERKRADTAKTALVAAQSELGTFEAKLADLKSGKQRSATQLLERGVALDATLPIDVSRTDLVAVVDSMAKNSGVVLGQMSPAPGTVKAGEAVGTTYDVQLTGPTTGVAALLTKIQRMDPLVTASGFTLSATPAAGTVAAQSTVQLKLVSWSVAADELKKP